MLPLLTARVYWMGVWPARKGQGSGPAKASQAGEGGREVGVGGVRGRQGRVQGRGCGRPRGLKK